VLNVVLDAYHQFGQRVPRLQYYKSLISERPDMTKCVAFMYQDLLQFYEKVIGLLTGQGKELSTDNGLSEANRL
jgi:hypothetical protein